ncbi:PPOX class F420-dependent oxidoreductase [Flexivirga sp. B27]
MDLAFHADPRGDQFYALKTFRKNGEPVATPIWLAPAGGRWYAYTPARTGKASRIEHTARVEVAPSDFHGAPRGEWVPGRALVLRGAQASTARRVLRAKYGIKFRFFELVMLLGRRRRHGGPGVGLQIVLDE